MWMWKALAPDSAVFQKVKVNPPTVWPINIIHCAGFEWWIIYVNLWCDFMCWVVYTATHVVGAQFCHHTAHVAESWWTKTFIMNDWFLPSCNVSEEWGVLMTFALPKVNSSQKNDSSFWGFPFCTFSNLIPQTLRTPPCGRTLMIMPMLILDTCCWFPIIARFFSTAGWFMWISRL